MIAIINYGVGNLFSLASSLKYIGEECEITADPKKIMESDKIILPGVGAFGDAINKLKSNGLAELVTAQAKSGKPLLGICLGMQLLFEKSFEYGEHYGLGLIPGEIKLLTPEVMGEKLKVPHMGWNSLTFSKKSPLLKHIKEGDYVYYVHSYYAQAGDYTTAYSSYANALISGVVQNNNIYGTQFHPEKSGDVGLAILRGFCGL